MSEPTEQAMRHGEMVNRIQNASLRFSQIRGDYRGAFPMTYDQAETMLFCLREQGIARTPDTAPTGVVDVDFVRRMLDKILELSSTNPVQSKRVANIEQFAKEARAALTPTEQAPEDMQPNG